MKEDKKIVIVRESNFDSYVADFFTFVSIVGSFWFNYRFIGGNDALDILLFVCFFIFAVGRSKDIKRQAKEATQEEE